MNKGEIKTRREKKQPEVVAKPSKEDMIEQNKHSHTDQKTTTTTRRKNQ